MARRYRVFGNVLILSGLFVFAGALVALIPFLRRSAPILPAESTETAAKRLAPENAYFLLCEAVDSLPKAPPFLLVPNKDNPKSQDWYRPAPGSLGSLINVERPDDDPQLIEYLNACEPALAKTREALKRPYFLLPIDWSDLPNYNDKPANPVNPVWKSWNIPALGGRLAARGLQSLRAGDEAGALAGLLDAVGLALFVRNDGADCQVSDTILARGLSCFDEMVRTGSDAMLEKMFAEIRRLHAELKPPVDNLTFILREIDCGAFPDMRPSTGGIAERVFNDTVTSLARRETRAWARLHRDELFAVVEGPFTEVAKWKSTAKKEEGRWGFVYALTSSTEILAVSQARTRVALDGAALVIALERYRRAQGGFPETLEALVPTYIDSIPKDPFTEGSLIYKRAGEDYQLFSAGWNQKDDGGGFIPEGRSQPLGDDVVIHWPRAAEN